MTITCEWFALCANQTTKATTHPILGAVPICDSCAERMEIEPELEIAEQLRPDIWDFTNATNQETGKPFTIREATEWIDQGRPRP